MRHRATQEPADPGPATRRGRGFSRRHWTWTAVAALIVMAGIVTTTVSAVSVANRNNAKSRAVFGRSTQAITASLKSAIQREDDLALNAGAYLAADPGGTQARFLRWSTSVRLLNRYPEVQTLGALVVVRAAQLPAFAATVSALPGNRGTPFVVAPPGPRASYCLTTLTLSRSRSTQPPVGIDYCTGDTRAPLLAARDSGRSSYGPYVFGSQTWLGVQIPVYASGLMPGTVAERRATFVGWVGAQINPAVILASALAGHRGAAVSMSYHVGLARAEFGRGSTSAPNMRSSTVDLHNGWTVHTFAVLNISGPFTDRNALTVLMVGIAFSLLAGVLVFVLATGRERARRLVEQRTGELRHQALHDALTGLPNRTLVADRVEQMLVRNRREDTRVMAMFVDLDDFKNVNDTLGHQTGDRLLAAVADRFRSTLRDADTIGRMGGDEFVVLVDGFADDMAPELVADRLLAVMARPFHLDGASVPLFIGVSIGIASGDRADGGELLRDADVALYEAKAAGKNRFATFRPEMQTTISRRIDLEFDLRSSLADAQFRLVYQPIFDLGDLALVGVEALLRWDHPRHGPVSPDEFIPILEQTGGIEEVGRWVLRQACAQMAVWHAGGDFLNLSVNVSSRQLDHDRITADVQNALRDTGLDARSLIVEVTETALVRNTEATARRLRALKKLGIRIAIDDFGTGYSSLAYLRQFPFDSLKIDRLFTSSVTSSAEAAAFVATLVQMGKALGLNTLAEGVETAAEMDLLRAADVDQAQGFLLGRPQDPQDFQALLGQRNRGPAVATFS